MLARMEENCIVSFITNNTDEPIEECPKAVLEGFQDYSLTLLGLNSPWIVFLIVCQIVCVTMTVAGKIFIMWFVKFKSIDRPMNAMIMIDEGIQVAPVLVRGIGTTCSLRVNSSMDINFLTSDSQLIRVLRILIWHLIRVL